MKYLKFKLDKIRLIKDINSIRKKERLQKLIYKNNYIETDQIIQLFYYINESTINNKKNQLPILIENKSIYNKFEDILNYSFYLKINNSNEKSNQKINIYRNKILDLEKKQTLLLKYIFGDLIITEKERIKAFYTTKINKLQKLHKLQNL